MNELALFAGAGGGILGGILNGWRTVCAVEINEYCRRVLMQRQDDGCLEPFPIWDDITTFDGRPWAGCVDIVTGGFPCQDISAAGKGAGISGERSGLWSEMARIIGEVRPRYVLVENSPMLTLRGLGTVLGDLAALGFDAEWGCISAAATGAPHKRDRMWIVASARGGRRGEPDQGQVQQPGRTEVIGAGDGMADPGIQLWDRRLRGSSWWSREPLEALQDARERGRKEDGMSIPESLLGRVADGVANRVDRLKALGNGQVPQVVAAAWETLKLQPTKPSEHARKGT